MKKNEKFYYGDPYSEGPGFDFKVEDGPLVNEAPAENTPTEDNTGRVRKIFSRVFLAAFAYLAVSQLSLILIELITLLAFGEEAYLKSLDNAVLTVIKSSVCQYLFGFAAFFLVIFKVPKGKCFNKPERMKPTTLIILFMVCYALSFIGGYIGEVINGLIGAISGNLPENTLDTIITSVPMWLIILAVVIVGPIFEELVFRKFMIDRLCCVGDYYAVLFTSVAFGLFHQNLYQLFYTALVGLILGFTYVKTRNILYPIILHVAFNFFGAAVPMLLEGYITEYIEMSELIAQGIAVDEALFAKNEAIALIYSTFTIALCVCGTIFGIKKLRGGEFRLSRESQLYIPKNKIADTCTLNLGAILFLITTVAFTVLQII